MMLGVFVGTVLGVMLGTVVGITLSERSWNWKTNGDGYRDVLVSVVVVASLIIVGFRAVELWSLLGEGSE
jgi:urea transporter